MAFWRLNMARRGAPRKWETEKVDGRDGDYLMELIHKLSKEIQSDEELIRKRQDGELDL